MSKPQIRISELATLITYNREYILEGLAKEDAERFVKIIYASDKKNVKSICENAHIFFNKNMCFSDRKTIFNQLVKLENKQILAIADNEIFLTNTIPFNIQCILKTLSNHNYENYSIYAENLSFFSNEFFQYAPKAYDKNNLIDVLVDIGNDKAFRLKTTLIDEKMRLFRTDMSNKAILSLIMKASKIKSKELKQSLDIIYSNIGKISIDKISGDHTAEIIEKLLGLSESRINTILYILDNTLDKSSQWFEKHKLIVFLSKLPIHILEIVINNTDFFFDSRKTFYCSIDRCPSDVLNNIAPETLNEIIKAEHILISAKSTVFLRSNLAPFQHQTAQDVKSISKSIIKNDAINFAPISMICEKGVTKFDSVMKALSHCSNISLNKVDSSKKEEHIADLMKLDVKQIISIDKNFKKIFFFGSNIFWMGRLSFYFKDISHDKIPNIAEATSYFFGRHHFFLMKIAYRIYCVFYGRLYNIETRSDILIYLKKLSIPDIDLFIEKVRKMNIHQLEELAYKIRQEVRNEDI